MNSVTAKRIGIVAGFIILLGSFAVFRILGNMKEPPKRKTVEQATREVEAFEVKNGNVPNFMEVQGTLVAFDKIGIFAEVTGTLKPTGRPFKVGTYYPKGTLLVNVEDTEARLSILSQKSNLLNSITQMMPDLRIDYPESFEQWSTYLNSFNVEEPLKAFPEPKSEQEKLFVASRNIQSQFYSIQSAEERLSKYQLYAPFSGVLTNVSINPGALVRVGQQLGELMKTSEYELEATIPLSELKYIKVGNPVKLFSEDVEGEWQGTVKRISD
ncbi:MAG: HlyD family efflux transporter periplasmic adaptor subunit, partial [Phaeodactylibacter sp.]|nr:HlyD family efflux transporter periplasmic adaptor subunit [Phaeodactylibacter sp.]